MDEGQFDFKHIDEEPDQDATDLEPCPHCKKPIPADALHCYYCSESVERPRSPLWVVWVALILVVVFGLFIITTL